MSGRDKEKNYYFTIGIAKDSKLMRLLENDAREAGTREITTIIKMRLLNCYELISMLDKLGVDLSQEKPTI